MLRAMSIPRCLGAAVFLLSTTGCFSGSDARGLTCRNDDQCGTKLECVRAAPEDELGVCGGGDLPTSESDTDTGPIACGVAPPVVCEGVAPLANPTFEQLTFTDPGFSGHISVAVGRFVGSDEWEDIALLNLFESDVLVYRSEAGSGFTRIADPFQTSANPFDIAAADFDCDGNGDLAVVSLESGQLVFAYGLGSTLEPFDTTNPRQVPNAWSLAVADFDPSSDGPEVLVACDGSSFLFGNTGDRTFGVPTNIATGQVPWSVVAGDLDGDEIPDVVIANSEQYDFEDADNNDFVTIALSGSSTPFMAQPYGPASLTNPIDAAILDLDELPGADLVVVSKHVNADQTVTTLNGTLSFHGNDGNGNFSPIRSDIPVGIGAGSLATADFNCDGDMDIAVGHDIDGVWIFWGPEHRLDQHTEIATDSAVGTRMEVADLDHDGYPDLVLPIFGRLDAGGVAVEDGGLTILWKAAP